MRTDSLLFIFFLAFMLAIFQNMAFQDYLYWRFWWYDIMMHFLGGAIVASSFLWTAAYEFPESLKKKYFRFLPVLVFVFVIGIIWEVFEYHIGINREYSFDSWVFDSAIDLVMDILGGSLAYFVFRRIHQKHG